MVTTLDLARRYLIMSNLEENWFDDASNAAETEVVPEKNKLHLKKTGDDVDWKNSGWPDFSIYT